MAPPMRSGSLTTTRSDLSRQLAGAVVAARPHQWVKNLPVFAAIVFTGLSAPAPVLVSMLAFAAFCLVASAVYHFNDFCDLEEDRLHPAKRDRPLASGSMSLTTAMVSASLLAGAALGLGFRINSEVGLLLAGYLTLNLGYSLGLKRVPGLDVLIVAVGFVFRPVAGAFAVGVVPSGWLVVSSLLLALFIGFGKRRGEMLSLGPVAAEHRASLAGYRVPVLDRLVALCGMAAAVTWVAYTFSSETAASASRTPLVLTIPFVCFGLWRFAQLGRTGRWNADPARMFLADRVLVVNALAWCALVGLSMYGGRL